MPLKLKVEEDNNASPFRRLPPIIELLRAAVRWYRLFTVKCLNFGKLTVGNDVNIGPDANVVVPQFMEIADRVGIGAYFLSQTNVRIGPECLVSSRVSFIGHDHDLRGGQSAYFSGRTEPSLVVLEGDNFIGFGATLCGNITLGRGAMVGAHALVLKSVPENAVVAGVPARIVGQREA